MYNLKFTVNYFEKLLFTGTTTSNVYLPLTYIYIYISFIDFGKVAKGGVGVALKYLIFKNFGLRIERLNKESFIDYDNMYLNVFYHFQHYFNYIMAFKGTRVPTEKPQIYCK